MFLTKYLATKNSFWKEWTIRRKDNVMLFSSVIDWVYLNWLHRETSVEGAASRAYQRRRKKKIWLCGSCVRDKSRRTDRVGQIASEPKLRQKINCVGNLWAKFPTRLIFRRNLGSDASCSKRFVSNTICLTQLSHNQKFDYLL